jgi:zinc/manganese transport system substrate-binding protein
MRRSSTRFSVAAVAGAALLLSACGQASDPSKPAATSSPGQARISVVTSTNVYGDIARTIGGEKVQVTPLISKISQDPHSYESTAQDKLALTGADLVIGNGAGYDTFLDTITKDLALKEDRILHAVDVAGPLPQDAHGAINEHLWYNMSSASMIAEEIASRLGAIDPADASVFTANAKKFTADTTAVSDKLAAIKTRHAGEGVALTEPLPVYMLEAAGLENRTPEDFLEAAEEGNDAPAGALKSTVDLVSSKSVRFLAYNEQTATPQTETVRKAAEAGNLPIVNFTETLPEGKTYIQWMNDNADSIETALRP